MNDLGRNEQVLDNGFFDIEGRIGRTKYALINLIALIVTTPILAGIGARNFGGQLFFGLLVFLVLAPSIVKRLHDIDRNGTWIWALLIPFVNVLLNLRLLLQPGTPNTNRFGMRLPTSPKNRAKAIAAKLMLNRGPLTAPPMAQELGIDEIYRAIAQEFESGLSDKGLWIRLYAECDGDEAKTKARYIKARVSKLSETHAAQGIPFNDLITEAVAPVAPTSTIAPSPRERERAMEEMIKRMR